MSAQWIPLDQVINQYIDEAEVSVHKYIKLWNIAYRGMEQMGLDFFALINSVKLPVNANNTVTLPNDYINYSKVGVLNSVGEIVPLKYNEKLTTFADLLPNRNELTQDNTIYNYQCGAPCWYNYWNGGYYTNLYGLPSGSPFIGSFKIDDKNGVILLDENFNFDYIMLEYIASPTAGQNYQIPLMFREAMIAWLWWRDSKAGSVRKGMVGVPRDLRHDFFEERRKARNQWKPLYLEDAYNWSQEMTRLTVKI